MSTDTNIGKNPNANASNVDASSACAREGNAIEDNKNDDNYDDNGKADTNQAVVVRKQVNPITKKLVDHLCTSPTQQ